MKANELMIGDWVKFIIGYKRIQEIAGDCVWFEDSNSLFPCKVKRIEPISITAEILEKNGFKIVHGFGHSESYPTYGWCYHKGLRDYASVDVTFYDEPIGGVSRLVKMETASKKDDGINSIHSCDIEFIHQLQHALRLCGIEKEIEL